MKYLILLIIVAGCCHYQGENKSNRGLIVRTDQVKFQENLIKTDNPLEYKVKKQVVITLDQE